MTPENNFEQRTEKNEVRFLILSQFLQFARHKTEVIVNSLPGARWLWENSLVTMAALRLKKTKIILNAFEREPSLRHSFPWHPILAKASFHNVDINYHNGADVDFDYMQGKHTFSWADYCGIPQKDMLDKFAKSIRRGDVVYITFTLKWRVLEALDSRVAKNRDAMGSEAAEHAITKTLEAMIRRKVGNHFTPIFYASYMGGHNNPMLTLGWHFKKNSTIKAETYIPENSLLGMKRKSKRVNRFDSKPILAMLNDGKTDEEIFRAFPTLGKMQLAGVKASRKRWKLYTHA